MPDTIRVCRPGFLISCCFLIVIASSTTYAQRRSIPPPKSLLQILDKDDRDCVLTNGGLSKSVRVRSIRLAADGSQQIVVRGSGSCLCGAQNCGFWIYRKQGGKSELLLTGAGSTKIQAARHSVNGYRDVVSESHASASETIIRTYRFDGAHYGLQRCVRRVDYDQSGNPTKTPGFLPCEERKADPADTRRLF
jgi:hypothetical protein